MASSSKSAVEIDELRKNARAWTLDGDAKLLEFMQTIAANLENRAQNTNCKLKDMVMNLQDTSISLDNVANKLTALQNSQFVENRVYEDDETIANIAEVPTEIQNGKENYDPIETLSKVLKNSISMMEKCYQKVSVDIEDSDDEEGLSKSIIYKPKNPFEERPLPHLIGSKEWKEKWHIGLCDTDEEYSDEENKDESSETSENVSLSMSLPSNAPTVSESDSSGWGLHSKSNTKSIAMQQHSSDEEISSNTFTSKTSSEEINKHSTNKSLIAQNFSMPSQEERYYVHKPKVRNLFAESSDESEEDNKRILTEKKVENTISNIFSDEPPDLDEVDKKDKHEDENTRLFYDSEEEQIKSNSRKGSARTTDDKYSNIIKKPVNLFDDDDFDSFMKELGERATEKLNENIKEKSVNLFDNTTEENPKQNQMPEPIRENKKTENPPNAKTENKHNTSIFDSETDDDVFGKNIKISKTSLIGAKTKVGNLFDDETSDDEFENIFKPRSVQVKGADLLSNVSGNLKEGNKVVNSQPSIDGKSNKIDSLSTNNNTTTLLFEPSFEDDIFSSFKTQNMFVDKMSSSENVQNNTISKKTDLNTTQDFQPRLDVADEDKLFIGINIPPVPAPRAVVVNISHNDSIQDNSKLGEDTFSSTIGKEKEINSELKKTDDLKSSNSSNPIREFFVNNELPEGNIFESSIEKNRIKTNSIRKIESEEDINSVLNSNTFTKLKSDLESNPNKFKLPSLFDDECPDDDDFLFSSAKTRTNNSNTTDNLFNDDNKLVRKSEENRESNNLAPHLAEVSSLFDAEPPDDEEFFFLSSKRTPSNSKIPSFENSYVNENTLILKSEEKEEKNNPIPTSAKVESNNVKEIQTVNISENIEKEELTENLNNDVIKNKLSPLLESKNSTKKENTKTAISDNQSVQDNETCQYLDKTKENDNTSASGYSSINLFQDIPPEDDFHSFGDTKRLHNIFYDDFAETISATENHSAIQSLNYFLSDEPPPDNFNDEKTKAIGKENEKNSVEKINSEIVESNMKKEENHSSFYKTETDNGNFSIAELAKKVRTGKTEFKPKSDISLPKKLNMNLNINVAALIPGAKMPSMRTDNQFQNQSSIEEGNTSSSISKPSEEVENLSYTSIRVENSPQNNSQHNSDSKILMNLNKTRARIQAKRKPSTRKGRQESYNKSLLHSKDIKSINESLNENVVSSDNKLVQSTNESSNQAKTHVISNSFEAIQKISDTLDCKQTVNEDWMVKISKNSINSGIEKSKGELSNKSHLKSTEKEEKDDDLFSSKISNLDTNVTKNLTEENQKTISKKEIKPLPSLFQEDSDDDIFGNIKNEKISNEKLNTSKSKTKIQEKIFSNYEDDDDDDDNDGDELFKQSIKKINIIDKQKTKILSVPVGTNLFGDDDEDDDELFTTKNKAPTRVVKIPKRPEKRSPAGSITEDNPLADLLNG